MQIYCSPWPQRLFAMAADVVTWAKSALMQMQLAGKGVCQSNPEVELIVWISANRPII